jgi:hypothetical protein
MAHGVRDAVWEPPRAESHSAPLLPPPPDITANLEAATVRLVDAIRGYHAASDGERSSAGAQVKIEADAFFLVLEQAMSYRNECLPAIRRAEMSVETAARDADLLSSEIE